jgi:hypothetical protein
MLCSLCDTCWASNKRLVRQTDINCVCVCVFTVKYERGRVGEAAQNYTVCGFTVCIFRQTALQWYSKGDEMPWAGNVRLREEKHVENNETIMALCVNIRILRCVPPCGLVQRYRGISFLRNTVSICQNLYPRSQKSAHKCVAKTLNTGHPLEDWVAYEVMLLKRIIKMYGVQCIIFSENRGKLCDAVKTIKDRQFT